MKTEQYEFVVQILRGGVSGGSLGDEWIECKGRVGYWYHKNGMVVSGRVVDPKGKPIVTLNANGLLIAKVIVFLFNLLIEELLKFCFF